jgi:hypothetical protein
VVGVWILGSTFSEQLSPWGDYVILFGLRRLEPWSRAVKAFLGVVRFRLKVGASKLAISVCIGWCLVRRLLSVAFPWVTVNLVKEVGA